jgi:precorrin-6B methylase 2
MLASLLKGAPVNTSTPAQRVAATIAVFAIIWTLPARAQQAAQTYEPQVGQAGKDVIWVPTPEALVDQMLRLAKVTPADYLIDLGSGDGRTVITAAQRGTRALGIEFNPDMVELSRKRAAEAGVSNMATFNRADIFESDLSPATVITMFLLPSLNLRLRPTILNLKPGTRIVSNSFTMDDWVADERATIEENCSNWCTALLWIVPAKVGGQWQLGNAPLNLTQTFQMVAGTLGTAPVGGGRLRGDEISFSVGNTRYTGRVNGATMQGTMSGAQTGNWTATRQ